MLKDRRIVVEKKANQIRRAREVVSDYGNFLAEHYSVGDWFVTITFRDRHKELEIDPKRPGQPRKFQAVKHYRDSKPSKNGLSMYEPDPRLKSWEPSSRNRVEPGPPVRDVALREIEHWLLELGWEAGNRRRQEIFDWLAEALAPIERRELARKLCGNCLCCALLEKDRFAKQFQELRLVATNAIHWTIAEEFGRVGGRWHVHLLVKGVSHLRRMKWWKRAFIRFGRTRIEAIHE
jgi:hypothetical protein